MQFGKMYDPISSRSKKIDEENQENEEEANENNASQKEKEAKSGDPWNDEEDRIANFYITTNPKYDKIPLPKIIKIKHCSPIKWIFGNAKNK